MPFGDYEDFDACVADNRDKRDPEAYCATIKRQIEGADGLTASDREAITASDHYSDRILEDGPCWDNYVMVGTKTVNGREVPNCVPEDEADEANLQSLAAADDRCGEGMVQIGDRCVDLGAVTGGEDTVPPSALAGRTLAEFDEGDAVTWEWQGETVHGRVSEVREEQATVSGDVTIEGDPDDEEPVYVIDEYDDAAGGYQSGNVAKPEASLDESPRDLPDRTDDNMLAAAQHLTLKSLETEPIERVQEGTEVRYRNLKLLSPGIWADAGSQTETYYPPEGVANLEAHYDESEHNGPPVNIMHDLDTEAWEAHEASVAGYVDPNTLDTDDDGNLYGDVVFDTDKGAGQFADDNLKSTLENEGTVGFGGPSVEIPGEGLQQSHDPQRDMPRVDGGRLTGVAMVMDPASKSVNFAREAARRPVAMSAAGGTKGKALTRKPTGMSKQLMDAGEVREIMEMFGIDTGDLDDEEVTDMAMDLHDDLMDEMEGDGEDAEMGDYGGEDDDEEDDMEMAEHGDEEDDEEDMEMADDDMSAMQDQLANLSARLEDLEDAMSQAMTAGDVDAELEDAAGNKLADAETVEELDRRLAAIEEQPAEGKTLADADNSDIDWSEADDGIDYDPATGSISR